MSSLGAGATVGGISALASGSLSKGITAGLGAYGGSELATGLGNFGDPSLTGLAAQAPSSAVGGMDPAQRAASAMAGNAPAADNMSRVFGGAKAAIANPSAFAGSMGGWGGVAKTGLMAAAPILTMPTATQMPTTGSQNTAFIRTSKYDPKTGASTQGEAIPASEWGSRDIGPYNFYGPSRTAANGGLTQHFAPGGPVETTTKMPVLSDSERAYQYLMGTGQNPFANVSYAPPAPKEEEKAKDTTGADDAGIGSLLPVIQEGGNDGLQRGHTPGEFGLPGATTNASGDSGPTTGLASFGNSLAATLGNLGLTGLSTSIAQSVDPNYGHEGRHSLSAPTVDTSPMGPALDTAIGPALDVDSTDVSSTETGPSSMGFGIEGGGYGGMSGDGNGGGGGADGSGGGPGDSGGPQANGGVVGQYAMGGITALAQGGMSSLGGYSDGGRLLRGPGDGVSDSIPAHIGRNRQPAQLADGEFVVPARIVSELGNGSTEAGARQLYKMMERIQAGRAKTTGKNKVAVNSRAAKHLPA